jgi:AcrR family transcriptional regulator
MNRKSARRRDAGGYARGTETRAKIIAAALEVFGAQGFEDASTRAIARCAGVNLAALHYYFGGKSALYLACAEQIASVGEARVAPFITMVQGALADPDLPRPALLDLLRRLLEQLTDRLAGPRDPTAVAAFFLREQIAPTEAYDIIHTRGHSRCSRPVQRWSAA